MNHERVFTAAFAAYVGCLLGAGASLAAPGPTWPVTLAGFVAAAVAGYGLARRLDLAATVTGYWRNLSLVVFPFAYLFPLVDRPAGLSPVEFLATPATLGLLGVGPALVAVVAGDAHRKRETLAEATVHAEFEARSAPRARKWQAAGGAALVLSGVLGGAVITLLGGELDPGMLVTYAATAVGGLTPLFAANGHEREVAVTDAGLKVQMQVHGWDTVSDYEVTDDALVLKRPGRLHASLKFDREDIEDLDAVEAALKRYLPREAGT